jgi:hypothetical protein
MLGGAIGTMSTSGHHHDNQNGMTARISHGRSLLMEPTTSLRATGHPQKGEGGCDLYAHTACNDMTKARHGTVEINVRNPDTMVAPYYDGAFDLQQV